MVSEKPWQIEAVLRLLLRLFACFVIGMLGASLLRQWLGNKVVESHLLNVFAAMLCFQGAVLILAALFLREQSMGWAAAFGFRNEPGWAILLGVCAAVVLLPTCWWLQAQSIEVFTRLGFKPDEQDTVRVLRGADTLWKRACMGGFAIILAPLGEEIFFRGIAYTALKFYGWPRLALWGTAAVFALIHGNLAAAVPLLFLAVALTLLYEWTNNLLACIVVHSLFNAANFVMLFALKIQAESP